MLKAIERPKGYLPWDMMEKRMQMYPPPANCVLHACGFPPLGSTLKDFSGQGNDGTITGASRIRLPSGLPAIAFDGTDDKVDFGNDSSLALDGEGGMEFWARLPIWNVGSEMRLLGNNLAPSTNDTIYISVHNTVGLHFRYGGTGQANNLAIYDSPSDSWANDSWHHIIASWSNSGGTTTLNIFADGALYKTGTCSLIISYGSNPTWVAGLMGGGYDLLGDLALQKMLAVAPTLADATKRFKQERHLFGV